MTEPAPSPAVRDLPDDLPPVKPPSVVFIFQLFVVPALIVAAVVAVWVLFGRLATGDQDWQSLVADLNSPNHHIRYRAMNGLAQVLDNDRRLGPAGQQLSQNSLIAQSLSEQLAKKLTSSPASQETLSDQVYLTRALGQLDLPELALSPLATALNESFDVEVRKGAITSIIFIGGRAWERGAPLTSPELSEAVIRFSQDADKRLRRSAAYALGLIQTDAAAKRLQVLLEDADAMTTANAANALSRRGTTAGYPVLKRILSGEVLSDPEVPDEKAVSEVVLLHNALHAVTGLAASLSAEQRAETILLVSQLAKTHRELRVRTDAEQALTALKAGQ